MFKTIRVTLLLLILIWVALDQWRSNNRATDWDKTLHVAIYPIAGDYDPETQAYLNQLNRADFSPIEAWLIQSMKPYRNPPMMPMIIAVAPPLPAREQPPEAPKTPDMMATVLWSLKLRWWAFRHDHIDARAHVRLFVVFHHPERRVTLPHSLGLQKGQLGVIHAFASADQAAQNNIVIAHELMHTLGAIDQYDMATNLPIYPMGYADPNRQPPWPQTKTEIMGGRRPISQTEAIMPESLNSVVIGEETARDIGLCL